jgi:hypothetical protein
MNQDFVTELRLQLREAALREERRSPVAQRVEHLRRGAPGPGPLAAALAVALLALAVAIGALALRGEPEPVKPKVIHTITVTDSLASMWSGVGAVWAADPVKGDVLRIDPRTRTVVKRIHVGDDAFVAAGHGAVWALTGDLQTSGAAGAVWLVRIDPARNRVVKRIRMRTPSGGNFAPVYLHLDADRVWVIGTAGALRIDPARNAADRFVPYDGLLGLGAIAEGERVWVLADDGVVRELDARSGRETGKVRLRAPTGMRLWPGNPGQLALVGGDQLTLLESRQGRRLWRTSLPGVRAVMFDGSTAWAYQSLAPARPDELARLDARSGRRTGTVQLPAPDVVGMTKVGDELWVATAGGTIIVVR